MKKLILFFSILIAFAGVINAQKSKLVGSWLLTKVEIGEKIQKPYQINEFNDDGKFEIMGIEVGAWEYNTKSNAIVMKSNFDKDFNGKATIIEVTDTNLELRKDNAKMYYKKVSMTEITENNKNSGLFGTWEFNNVPNNYTNTFINFTEPDEFTIIQKQEGMSSKQGGVWMSDKKEMSLILIGLRSKDVFSGKNKIVNINGETIEIENNGTIYKGNKVAEKTSTIERLTFTDKDFYDENGEYLYDEDENKLPWNDSMEMMMTLVNVKQLVYNYSTLIEGVNTFESKLLTANVNSNPQEQELSIDYIFNGYDNYNLPEDTALPTEAYQFSSSLYPLTENTFRIVGEEEIITPASTFNCAIVEAIEGSDEKLKIWMIIDKPGIFAKIIKERTDDMFGYYHIYMLQEIK